MKSTIKVTIVEPGDELPCHQSNIIKVEDITKVRAVRLRLWWIEDSYQGDDDD